MTINEMIDEILGKKKEPELNEGLADTVKGALSSTIDFFKKKYAAAKAVVEHIKNKTFLLLFSDKSKAAVAHGKKVLDTCQTGYGGSENNTLVISVMKGVTVTGNGKQMEGSFLSQLGKELNEAGDLDDADFDPEATLRPQGMNKDSEERGHTLTNQDQENIRKYGSLVSRGMNLKNTPVPKNINISYKKDGQESLSDLRTPVEENILGADDVMEIIRRLGYQLKFRKSLKDFVPSVLIFGVPGQGKTFICKQMADELGMHFRGIEVAALYREVFGGMPVADEKVRYVDETGNEIDLEGEAQAAEAAAESAASDKLKIGDGAAPKKRGRPLKAASESISVPAGMIVESLTTGETLVGKASDIAMAKVKYGLVQQWLTGKMSLEETKNTEFEVQAYALRERLTGESAPAYIYESAEYQHYSLLTEHDDNFGQKTVTRTIKLKAVEGVLPPSNDSGAWLLLLDEFNRQKENMNAAMNLLLSGSIGSIYFLPLKTLVCVAGNIGGQNDNEQVVQMSQAMITRFNSVVRYQASAADSSEFFGNENPNGQFYLTPEQEKKALAAKKDGKTGIESKNKDQDMSKFVATDDEEQLMKECYMPSAWVNFSTVHHAYETKQDYDPVQLASWQDDAIIPLNNRYIERVATNMRAAAVQDWVEDNLTGGHDKEWYERNYTKMNWYYFDVKSKNWIKHDNFVSPVNMYLQFVQLTPKYLGIINASLLKNGAETLEDLLGATNETKRFAQIGTVEHILLAHHQDSDNNEKNQGKDAKLDEQFKKTCMMAKNSVMISMCNSIKEIGSEEKYAELMKKNKIKTEFAPLEWLTINIMEFCRNAMATPEEIYGLAYDFNQSIVSETDKAIKDFLKSVSIVLCQMDEALNSDGGLKVWVQEFGNIANSTIGSEFDNAGGSDANWFDSMNKTKSESNFLSALAKELLMEEDKKEEDKKEEKEPLPPTDPKEIYYPNFNKDMKFATAKWVIAQLKLIIASPQRDLVESYASKTSGSALNRAWDVISFANVNKIIKVKDKLPKGD